jgi:hypothetical protein
MQPSLPPHTVFKMRRDRESASESSNVLSRRCPTNRGHQCAILGDRIIPCSPIADREGESSAHASTMSLRLGQRPCVDGQPEEESGVYCCRRFDLAWPAWRNCDGNEASSARAKGAKGSFDFPIVRLKPSIWVLYTGHSIPSSGIFHITAARSIAGPRRFNRFVGGVSGKHQRSWMTSSRSRRSMEPSAPR